MKTEKGQRVLLGKRTVGRKARNGRHHCSWGFDDLVGEIVSGAGRVRRYPLG